MRATPRARRSSSARRSNEAAFDPRIGRPIDDCVLPVVAALAVRVEPLRIGRPIGKRLEAHLLEPLGAVGAELRYGRFGCGGLLQVARQETEAVQ